MEGPEANRKYLHQNLLRVCVLGRDRPVKLSTDSQDFNPLDIPHVQDVPVEWYLPPLNVIPIDDPRPEDKSASVLLQERPAEVWESPKSPEEIVDSCEDTNEGPGEGHMPTRDNI